MTEPSTRARHARRRLARLQPIRIACVVLLVALLVAGFSFVLRDRRVTPGGPRQSIAASVPSASLPVTGAADATSSVVATYAAAPSAGVASMSAGAGVAGQYTTSSADPVPTTDPQLAETTAVPPPAPSAVKAAPKAPRPVVKPSAPSPVARSLDAYRGLGSWVDIYDDRAWNDPRAAVRDMAGHGVRTLFLETSNAKSTFALKDPAALRTFIQEAHARHMLVVAWYRPDVGSPADYPRIVAAIRFRTPDGQTFDSFALDIESSSIGSQSERNRALEALSLKIRALVGPSYPLGAIIPSPTGLARPGSYWGDFPYTMLARTYDVFVPMSYYTWHGSGAAAARADTLSNVRIIRAQRGCSKTPIHLIGGLAEDSSTSEVQAFVSAGRETGCIGASLYGWVGTNDGLWQQLKAVTQLSPE